MGSKPLDLELLREILGDKKTYSAVAKVLDTELASDRSVLFAKCNLLTQDRIVIAKVAWDSCGPNAGFFQFPQIGDLVLVEFPEGDNEQALLTKRLSSKSDTIPPQASSGDSVVRSLAGKNLHLLSDTLTLLGRGGENDPEENLVLGQVFKTLMSTILQKLDDMATDLAAHVHISSIPGAYTSVPASAAVYTGLAEDFADLKADPVDNEDVLSDLAFTEK